MQQEGDTDINTNPSNDPTAGPSDSNAPPVDGPPPKKKMKPSAPRTSRACLHCRKQKMRCEGADNPPCKRCAAAGHECVFERRADYLLNPEDVAWQSRIESRVEVIAQTVDRILSFLNGQGSCPPPNASQPNSALYTSHSQQQDQLQAYQYEHQSGSSSELHQIPSPTLSSMPNFDTSFASFSAHDHSQHDPNDLQGDSMGIEGMTAHFDPDARYSFASDPGLAAIDGLLRQVADRVAADSRQSSESNGDSGGRMPNPAEQDRLIDFFNKKLHPQMYGLKPFQYTREQYVQRSPMLYIIILCSASFHSPQLKQFAQPLRARASAVAKYRLDAWQSPDGTNAPTCSRDATDDVWALCIGHTWLGMGSWLEIGVTDAALASMVKVGQLREAFKEVVRDDSGAQLSALVANSGDPSPIRRLTAWYFLVIIRLQRACITMTDTPLTLDPTVLQVDELLAAPASIATFAAATTQIELLTLLKSVDKRDTGSAIRQKINSALDDFCIRTPMKLNIGHWTGLAPDWGQKALNLHHQFARLYVNASALSEPVRTSEGVLSTNIAVTAAFALVDMVRRDDVIKGVLGQLPGFMVSALTFAGAFLLKVLRMQECDVIDVGLRRESVFTQVQDVCTIMRASCASPLAFAYHSAVGLQELLEMTSALSMRASGQSRPGSRSGRPHFQRQASAPLGSRSVADFFSLDDLPASVPITNDDTFLYQPEMYSNQPFSSTGDGGMTAYDLFDNLLPRG